MSTLVLEVKFIDDTQSVDKEFTDLTALSVWLHGQRESDFDWLCLHDNNNDYVFEGWSDIVQYIRENTGTVKTPDVCSIHCSHGKGLACPVCYDQTHSLENSEFVVDPFDTYESHELPPDLSQCGDACNCMKCNPSKSSCIDLRETDAKIEAIGTLIDKYDDMVRFSDLPDGAEFYLAQSYAYGGRKKYQKVLEDGGPHNAVLVGDTNCGTIIPPERLVIRA